MNAFNRKNWRAIGLVVVLAIASACGAKSSTAPIVPTGSSSLTVMVKGDGGAPRPGAKVKLTYDGTSFQSTSDETGKARFSSLANQLTYTVSLAESVFGYTFTPKNVVVSNDTTTEAQLEPADDSEITCVTADGSPSCGIVPWTREGGATNLTIVNKVIRKDRATIRPPALEIQFGLNGTPVDGPLGSVFAAQVGKDLVNWFTSLFDVASSVYTGDTLTLKMRNQIYPYNCNPNPLSNCPVLQQYSTGAMTVRLFVGQVPKAYNVNYVLK